MRPLHSMNSEQGRLLTAIARAVISKQLGIRASMPKVSDHPWLDEFGATFVTLKKSSKLRGCIGSLKSRQSLINDLQDNAVSAAIRDPRFPPVTADELDSISIEVSVLTEPEPIHFNDEGDALAQLKAHEDGVIFQFEKHRSTFLPQVWEQLPNPELFMANLKQKAGLASDFWSDGVLLYRYRVEKFSENDHAE